jgi:LPS-assembly lipoprotein
MTQRSWKFALLALCSLLLCSCGFELRGTTAIPFKTLWVNVGDTSPVAVAIKRSVRGNGPTKIVADSKDAEASLQFVGESVRTDILTINSTGAAAEYTLTYHIRFRVVDSNKHVYIPVTELTLTRLLLANSNAILSESFEINQLIKDMQADAAHQVLRRLERLTPGQFSTVEEDVHLDPQLGPAVPLLNQALTPLTNPGS